MMAEKLDWRTFMSASADMPAKSIKALDDYFSQFVAIGIKEIDGKKEIEPLTCVGCDEALTGFAAALLGKGGFEWGLVHGQGHCRNCGWPAFGHHFIKDEDGADVATLRNFILQVHPDFVSKRAA